MKTQVDIRYVVYEIDNIKENMHQQVLNKVTFDNVTNGFKTEDDAINQLIKDGLIYTSFTILKDITLL